MFKFYFIFFLLGNLHNKNCILQIPGRGPVQCPVSTYVRYDLTFRQVVKKLHGSPSLRCKAVAVSFCS